MTHVESEEEHLWHKKESRKKLLVLDLNGLLADIVDSKQVEWTKRCNMPEIRNKIVFQRPFLKDFLQFCFEKFEVGIWSSRNKENVKGICNHLLGNLQKKLLFCWDMSQCTKTGAKCLENSKKDIVFKDLNRIWENRESNLLWKKGDYSESNTVLLDDSPYKAFLNPPHTAIFPDTYCYHNKEDTSLGDGGDLRLYLEKLVETENVQEYIQKNPFGQEAIKEGSKDWATYNNIV